MKNQKFATIFDMFSKKFNWFSSYSELDDTFGPFNFGICNLGHGHPENTFVYQYMLGSPFSTNRAKAVLKPSPAPSTNKASLLFWLVQFLAAKQIIGGDNLPCGFLAPSVGFWRDFQHVCGMNPGLRKVHLKNCPFWRKIVVSRLETL